MVDVEKEMMKEIMADYHSGDPRKVASAKEQILNKAQRLITFMIKKYFPTYIPRYYAMSLTLAKSRNRKHL